nr:hypothetical protein [Tanacetum cinerariifolium]
MTWISIFTGKSGYAASSTAEDVTKGVDGTGLTAIVTVKQSIAEKIPNAKIEVMELDISSLDSVRKFATQYTSKGLPLNILILNAGIMTPPFTLSKDNIESQFATNHVDISSLDSVRKFATQYSSKGLPLNILILNAGVMAPPFTLSKDNIESQFATNHVGIMTPPFTLSKDNIESQFATNHVGNFHLTNLLLDTMKKTAKESGKEGRVVVVSSQAHRMTYKEGIRFDKINDEKSYNAMYAYGQSKLAGILYANELTKRLQAEGVNITANSLHPGVIKTNLARHGGFF